MILKTVFWQLMDRDNRIRIPHPLPKNTQPHPWLGVFYMVGIRTHPNAARMSAAGEGLTEPLNNEIESLIRCH